MKTFEQLKQEYLEYAKSPANEWHQGVLEGLNLAEKFTRENLHLLPASEVAKHPAVKETLVQYNRMLVWLYENHPMASYSEMIKDAEQALKPFEEKK